MSPKGKRIFEAASCFVMVNVLVMASCVQLTVAAGYTDVTVSEAKSMIDSKPLLVLLDVRTQSEYDSGHIRNAKLIPVDELASRLDELNEASEILVYCRSGGRSSIASQILVDNGFLHVYNMLGGVTAWVDAGYVVFVKYVSIQQAINDANEGDALYVSSGTYLENIVVNKTLSLFGEDEHTAIIDGGHVGDVVTLNVTGISIMHFTLQNGGNHGLLGISTSANTISHNIITGNHYGLAMYSSDSNVVSNNVFNHISDYGVLIEGLNNTVHANNVSADNVGLWINSSDSTISCNVVSSCMTGVLMAGSQNVIFHNNFINNTEQVDQTIEAVDNSWDNGCEGNYWSNYNGTDLDNDGIGDTYLPWLEVDSYPLLNRFWNPCDINHDLKVDIKDIATAALAYGSYPGHYKWNPHCDITGPTHLSPDDKIDMRDLALMAKNYGKIYQ